MSLFPLVGATSRKTPKPMFVFPSGSKVTFDHLERYSDCLSYQGSQIPLIEFDELTHFDERVFWYMLSRNRSDSGVPGYIRASTNPDPDSWVRKLIAWWIGPDGYAIPERSGVIRWFIRVQGNVTWGDTKEEMLARQVIGYKGIVKLESRNHFPLEGEEGVVYYNKDLRAYYTWNNGDYEDLITPKSVTFIASLLSDNAILMRSDPSYLANMKALPYVEQERLLGGNWDVRPSAGDYFPRSKATIIDEIPNDVVKWVRAWDLAATEDRKTNNPEDGPAFTAGVLMGKRRNGRYVIADVINKRMNSSDVMNTVLNTAKIDKKVHKRVKIRLSQDPGQAGKAQIEQYIKMLSGFSVSAVRETGDKITRAEPFSAQWIGVHGSETGNVDVLNAEWTEAYLSQMDACPQGKFWDMIDASSNGFNELESMNTSSAPPKKNNLTRESYWRR